MYQHTRHCIRSLGVRKEHHGLRRHFTTVPLQKPKEPRSQRTGPTPADHRSGTICSPTAYDTFQNPASLARRFAGILRVHARPQGALYNDVRTKGSKFLRNLYESSCISTRQQTKTSQMAQLKAVVRGFGYDPKMILVKEALREPHQMIVRTQEDIGLQTFTLTNFLRRTVLQELKNRQRRL